MQDPPRTPPPAAIGDVPGAPVKMQRNYRDATMLLTPATAIPYAPEAQNQQEQRRQQLISRIQERIQERPSGPDMVDVNRADIHFLIGRVVDLETQTSRLMMRLQAMEKAVEVMKTEMVAIVAVTK